jgi:hypothetical protein
MIIEVNGHQVEVDDSFADLSPEQQQIELQHIVNALPKTQAASQEDNSLTGVVGNFLVDHAPEVGALGGFLAGAAQGPNIAKSIEPVVQAGAKKLPGQGVKNYIAATTDMPFAGGKDYGTAYEKASIAAGQPVKSRGSQTPIRRGSLGLSTQPEEPSFLKRAGTNITSTPASPAGRAGSAFRMGAAGSLGGKTVHDLREGNYGEAALHGTGALAALAGQSRYKPLRMLGNVVTAGEVAGGVTPFFTPKKPENQSVLQEKAAGGAIPGYNRGKQVKEIVEGGLGVLKKPSPAAGRAGQFVEPTAETSLRKKFQSPQKFSEAIEPYIDTHSLHPTIVDRTILDLNAGRMAGPEAPYLQVISEPHREASWSFANDSLPAASKLYNIGKDGKTLVTGLLGSPTQLKTNRSVFGELTDEFFKAIKEGKMTPELQAKIEARLPMLTHGKDKIQTFPNKFDIRDRQAFEEMSKGFHQRGHLADIMGGKGVSQGVPGGGKIIPYEDILIRNTEQSLLDAPTHSIGSRLFTVGLKPPEYRPDLHNAFDWANFGELKSGSFGYVPKEIAIPDELARIKANLVSRGYDRDVTAMDIMRNSINQPITEQLWRRAQSEGFAKGGEVQGYNKGKKVVDATRKLILPPAENAARTQIIGTLPTYEKAGSILRQQGATGRGIDFGAGLGQGAKALGKDFDTYEPFAKNWTPTYSNAADVPSDAYGQLTNLNVLNVVPREVRDEIVQDIGRVMQPGGMGIITTRGKDVMNAKGLAGPEPMSVITSRDTYQKGFNKDELEEYLKYMLGDNFEIGRLNLGPAGAMIKKKAEGGLACMKEGGKTPAWQRAEGKNPEGGLNAAGRASYNRETGGNLKAPQPEGGSRKKSFCARMSGMKKKLTSSETANDPDSRINKSLRKWKC